MHRIGEDRTERLDIVPARSALRTVPRTVRSLRERASPRARHRAPQICLPRLHRWCQAGTRAGSPDRGVRHRPPPVQGRCRTPTEGAIAHVLVGKYADHPPLHRQSQILARAGIDIHRSTLADWVGGAGFHLRPAVDRLAEHLKASTKLFMDGERRARQRFERRGERGAGPRSRAGPDQDRLPLGAGPRRSVSHCVVMCSRPMVNGAAPIRPAWSTSTPPIAADRTPRRSCTASTGSCSSTAIPATTG